MGAHDEYVRVFPEIRVKYVENCDYLQYANKVKQDLRAVLLPLTTPPVSDSHMLATLDVELYGTMQLALLRRILVLVLVLYCSRSCIVVVVQS